MFVLPSILGWPRKLNKIMNTIERKTRPDDQLGNLPQEQKQRIIGWFGELTYDDVLKKIADAPPEGLGLKVQYTSLRRFFGKYIDQDLLKERQEANERLRHFMDVIEAEPAPYEALTREFFQKNLFLQSMSPGHHGDKFIKNFQLMLNLRAQELKEKYYELAKARLQAQSNKEQAAAALQVFSHFQAQIGPHEAQNLPPQTEMEAISPPKPTPLLANSASPMPAQPVPEELPDHSDGTK